MLASEKLDVYRCAVEFLALVGQMIDAMPSGTAVVRVVSMLTRMMAATASSRRDGASRDSSPPSSHNASPSPDTV